MSFVMAQPDSLATAASALNEAGSALAARNAAAATLTTGVIPAAADEVSALTAAQFAIHGQMYHGVSARAAAVHQVFTTTSAINAGSYAATEAANATAAR